MNNIVDLNKEREISALINKLGNLISADPDLNERTFDYLLNEETVMVDTDKTKTVSVRFPIELLQWIDSYSRIAAVNTETRITRNTTVIGFLETMKALMEYQSKTQWGGKSHQQMIKEVLESGQNREETQHHEVTP